MTKTYFVIQDLLKLEKQRQKRRDRFYFRLLIASVALFMAGAVYLLQM